VHIYGTSGVHNNFPFSIFKINVHECVMTIVNLSLLWSIDPNHSVQYKEEKILQRTFGAMITPQV